jgi:hypothetical protein
MPGARRERDTFAFLAIKFAKHKPAYHSCSRSPHSLTLRTPRVDRTTKSTRPEPSWHRPDGETVPQQSSPAPSIIPKEHYGSALRASPNFDCTIFPSTRLTPVNWVPATDSPRGQPSARAWIGQPCQRVPYQGSIVFKMKWGESGFIQKVSSTLAHLGRREHAQGS